MRNRIVVTGMGIISAIGNTVAENHDSLRKGFCGISRRTNIPSRYADLLPFGSVKADDDALRHELKISEPGITRTSLLALHAFEEAIHDAGLTRAQLHSRETALIGGTTVGGMCLMDQLYADAQSDQPSQYYESYDSAAAFLYLRKRAGMSGIVNTINTACSSSANAIMYGAGLIHAGLANRAIVGGTDSLSKFTINGFNALHILSDGFCRPFDKNRKGLNLGEAAAFLVLEKETDAKDKKKYAQVSGYANCNDAFHPSSLSEQGDGPYLAMQQALSVAGLQPGEISHINTHGTATENNDASESKAMIRLFGTPPAFVSTKSYTGHTLGAASAVEAVYSIFSIHHNELYPALHFADPIEETGLRPITQRTGADIAHVMSNSFGFGGNCSSLIFSKPR